MTSLRLNACPTNPGGAEWTGSAGRWCVCPFRLETGTSLLASTASALLTPSKTCLLKSQKALKCFFTETDRWVLANIYDP